MLFALLLAAQLGPGKFLVAPKEAWDPNFAQAVVLLVKYDPKEGAMGLIVNRQTAVPLSRVIKEAKHRQDPVYTGGPVSRGGALALMRSRSKPDDADHIFRDVYLVNSRDLLHKKLAEGAADAQVRVYLGYAGWSPGQLESEVKLGMWHVMTGDPGHVFDPQPASLWRRLIERTEWRIAARPSDHRILFLAQRLDRIDSSRTARGEPGG